MNFWTFLDRNSEGLFLLVVVGLCFAFGTCGDGKGCHFKVSTDGVTSEPLFDGGAH